jgi:hypothetical protein
VSAVAAAQLDNGTPIIINGGDDGAVRVWRLDDSGPNTRATGYQVSGRWGARNRTMLHWSPQIPGSSDFYPDFYPKTRRGRIKMSYLLVTAAN